MSITPVARALTSRNRNQAQPEGPERIHGPGPQDGPSEIATSPRFPSSARPS